MDFLSERDIFPKVYKKDNLPSGQWLILAPHPDDETFAMGGTIALARESKIPVKVLFVTLGEMFGDKDIRRGEAEKALNILGVNKDNIFFMEIPDRAVYDNKSKFKKYFLNVFKTLQVNYPLNIFIPSLFDYHPDHRVTTWFFIDCIKEFKVDLWFYETYNLFPVNVLVDISKVADKKFLAMSEYKSQVARIKYNEIFKARDKFRSFTISDSESDFYAEPFWHIPSENFLEIDFISYCYSLLKGSNFKLNKVDEDFLKDILNKNFEIQSLKELISQIKVDYQNNISNLNNHITTLKESKDFLESRYNQLIDYNNILQSKLEEALKDLINANKEKTALDNYYRGLVKHIHSSFSWRVTLPLRLLTGTLKKLKHYIVTGNIHLLKSKIESKIKQSAQDNVPFNLTIPSDEDIILSGNLRTFVGLSNYQDIKISILMVTYNSAQFLGETLNSILKSIVKPFELTIVDNNSSDTTISLIEGFRADFEKSGINLNLLKSSDNRGFGAGINQAAQNSSGTHFLIMNPDALLFPDTIGYMVQPFLKIKDLGVVEARHIPYEHPKLYSPVTLEPCWVSGCFFLIKSDDFFQIKGFDENIFLYAEDVDLSWRIKIKNKRVLYLPLAKIFHDDLGHRDSLKNFGPISNCYIRGKYRNSINIYNVLWLAFSKSNKIEAIELIYKCFLAYLKGCSNKIESLTKLPTFPDTGFGYEVLRRRGHDVRSDKSPNSTNDPMVSVIVRTHKRGELLKRTLISILNQTYKSIEILVIEDKSNEAEDVVAQFKPFIDIKLLKTDYGRTRALNIGKSECSGKFIMFLDDDDVIFGDAVETLINYALKDGKKFVYGGSMKFKTDNKIDGVLSHSHMTEFDKDKIMIMNYIPMGSFIIEKEFADEIGEFDESIEFLEDWDFITRGVLIAKDQFLLAPKDILIYTIPTSSKDAAKRQEQLDSTYSYVVKKREQIKERIVEIK